MNVEFTVIDPSTWPPMLTADEVAQSYRRQPSGQKKACQERKFIPAPISKQPYRWRKADVEKDIFGPRRDVSFRTDRKSA